VIETTQGRLQTIGALAQLWQTTPGRALDKLLVMRSTTRMALYWLVWQADEPHDMLPLVIRPYAAGKPQDTDVLKWRVELAVLFNPVRQVTKAMQTRQFTVRPFVPKVTR
jgi:hypothetical protein